MLGGELLAHLWANLFNIIWPPTCYGCSLVGCHWCDNCQAQLTKNWHWRQFTTSFTDCHLKMLFCASYHDPIVNRLIKLTKHYRLNRPGKILANNLACFINHTIAQTNWFKESAITFIPLSQSRKNWRGFNQSEFLASAIAKNCGNVLLTNWHRQYRVNQTGLNREQRLKNLENSIIWSRPIKFNRIIIIDDIVTTGSTLRVAAKSLLKAGAKEVIAIALAH